MIFRVLLDENEVNWAYWPYKKMNNTAGIMNFDEPEEYAVITKYALSDRGSFKKIRDNCPNRDSVQIALNRYIENCKFQNCYHVLGQRPIEVDTTEPILFVAYDRHGKRAGVVCADEVLPLLIRHLRNAES